jgi:hypothetical protein
MEMPCFEHVTKKISQEVIVLETNFDISIGRAPLLRNLNNNVEKAALSGILILVLGRTHEKHAVSIARHNFLLDARSSCKQHKIIQFLLHIKH